MRLFRKLAWLPDINALLGGFARSPDAARAPGPVQPGDQCRMDGFRVKRAPTRDEARRHQSEATETKAARHRHSSETEFRQTRSNVNATGRRRPVSSGAAVMVSKPTRADLIWQAGFRAGPRIRRYVARVMAAILAAIRLGMRAYGLPSRRHP
jgi:hypothetical protein